MSGQEIKHKCYNIAPAVSATKNKAEEVDSVGRNVLVCKKCHLNRPEKRGKLSYDGICRGCDATLSGDSQETWISDEIWKASTGPILWQEAA